VELKLAEDQDPLHAYYKFESNQSGIETNLDRLKRDAGAEFESNQSGIETKLLNVNLHWKLDRLNRTRVELKPSSRAFFCASASCLNRTRVELKRKVQRRCQNPKPV